MGEVKLSERIRKRKREYWADAEDIGQSAFERSRLSHVADGLEEAAVIAEQHERRLESANTELTKRVAELERDSVRMKNTEVVNQHIREHEGILLADLDEVKAAKARLLGVNQQLCKEKRELLDHIAGLQSQLAWTPVREGLPTEPGMYEFATKRGWVYSWRLDADGCWQDEREDDFYDEPVCDMQPFVSYRRIECGKGGES